jgi:hypothetical protein
MNQFSYISASSIPPMHNNEYGLDQFASGELAKMKNPFSREDMEYYRTLQPLPSKASFMSNGYK